jgi:6-phosphogluconolactonase
MRLTGVTLFILATILTAAIPPARAADEEVTVFIGTYTRGWACPPPAEKAVACTSKGIYAASFNTRTGALGTPTLAAESVNPSYLAVHPGGRFLYAVNEIDDWKASTAAGAAAAAGGKPEKTGGVSAFAIEPGGKLRLINQLSSHGADPCHVSLTRGGKQVLVANYSGGTVASYLVGAGGELAEGSFLLDAGAHGPHANQDAAHAHFIVEGPTAGLVYVADLGLDQVLLYDLDARGQLKPHAGQPFAMVTPPGSGPRHLAVHPSRRFLITNNELGSTASVFARDPRTGALTQPSLQTISTVPEGHKGQNDNAELQLSADGRFAYVSNRGHDSITTFALDKKTGKLTTIDNVPSGGKSPRDFKLTPNGRFLIVGHQVSDQVVVFPIDPRTGKLGKPVGGTTVSKPVNFAFAKVRR